ncbi:hypothetical protein [Pseudomonas fluorescens]|uniref:Uncharacterized protein n=1 Tax=Pseudomonas fluorescens TaxID=294 RepID=A0A5E7SQC8_PSEFL|nr:hypothetical protein [Pseudomonas fluorescens]VVP89042.1 hypothetical protein PS928_01477 [Pseudomonas fluorescens]
MTEELLSNSVAAQTLCELEPEKSVEQWMHWLQNNRNQSRRVPYRIPFERMAGGVFYRREELVSFIDWEKSRQLGALKLTGRAAEVMRAYGIGEKSGSATGRKLKVTAINPQVDEATGTPFVQFITSDPLMVYRLELDEAEAIIREMAEAVGVCKRSQQ